MEAPQPDVSERWIQHQRRNARVTQTWACTDCPNKRVFASDQDLKTHAEVDHCDQLPTEDGGLEAFLDTSAAFSATKRQPNIDSSDLRKPDKIQPRTISGIGTLKIDTPRGSEDGGIRNLPEDSQASEENLLRRRAVGDRTSVGSGNPFRDSSLPLSPGNSTARPALGEYESISDLYALPREMQSRPQMGKQLWTEDQKPLAKSSVTDAAKISPMVMNKVQANWINRKTRRPFQPPSPQFQSPRNSTSQIPQDNQGRPPPTPTETDQHPSMLESYDIVLQPETRPISQEQLIAEVKGIYAGLVMVEAKCIEVDNKQAILAQADPSAQPKLNNEQWQALIALHRTLLHEHHDFFLASQHPSASPVLRRLASKYAMPARMWRHGIHSFLEPLRHRLPASLDQMLASTYLAYSVMAPLYETVPAFEDTWIECLGDLGRNRMAIEDDDIRDREVWTGVARHWYSKASDNAPTTVLNTDVPMEGSSISKATASRGIKGKVKGHDIWAFGDTGAAQNIISARQAKKLQLKVVKSPRNLRMGNSKTVFSQGVVTFPWAFAESPDKITNVTAHVLDNFKYDILLCRSFLEDTKTMTDHVSRFVKGIFRRQPIMSFNLLGETSHRLNGFLEGDIRIEALPDTGSTQNIINEAWAKAYGLLVQSGPQNCGIVYFPDGSSSPTTGRVHTTITLPGGAAIPIVFEVLPDCYVPVVLGADFVFDHNIFSDHLDAIHEIEGVDCGNELLPMDYEQPPWYAKVGEKAKVLLQPKLRKHKKKSGLQPEKISNDSAEQDRQHRWNDQYQYGKAATREEWEAELSLRESHELRQYPDWRPDPNRPLIKHPPTAGNEAHNHTAAPLEDSSGHSYNYDTFGVYEAAVWQAGSPG